MIYTHTVNVEMEQRDLKIGIIQPQARCDGLFYVSTGQGHGVPRQVWLNIMLGVSVRVFVDGIYI